MKYRLTAAMATVLSIVGLCSVGSAWAKINCHNWACVNRALNNMQATVTRDDKFLSAFAACFSEVPITSYGDGKNATFGYVYNPGGGAPQQNTTALDFTQSGQVPDAWIMSDSCRKSKAATDHAASDVFAPIAPIVPLVFGVQDR